MAKGKNFRNILAFATAGIFLVSFTAFAHGGQGNQGCGFNSMNGNYMSGSYSFDNSRLSKEQLNKIDQIQDKYNKETIPLIQNLNLLNTKAYNYSLDNNTDIEKIKETRKDIRETQGKIDDIRFDELAEINKVLPEDQQQSYDNYLYQCWGNNGYMNNSMMGNGMYGMMNGYGMGSMMGGYGIMNGYGTGGMMGGYGSMYGNGHMHGNNSQ